MNRTKLQTAEKQHHSFQVYEGKLLQKKIDRQ